MDGLQRHTRTALRGGRAMAAQPPRPTAAATPPLDSPADARGPNRSRQVEPDAPRVPAQPTEADWVAIAQALEDGQTSGGATAPTDEDRVAIERAINEAEPHSGSEQDAADLDVARQTRPLHEQIARILAKAGRPLPSHDLDLAALSREPQAQAFARLLSRLPQAADKKDPAYDQRRRKLLNDAADVIASILSDRELRTEVFAMAINALGSCGDSVHKGFSDIVHATHIHRMRARISSGNLRPREFADWGRREFRLHKLQELAMAHIQAQLRTNGDPHAAWVMKNEPLQLMLQAEVQAGKLMDLPDSACRHASPCFAKHMPESTVSGFVEATRKAEEDGSELREFLMSNPVWREGLRRFDADDFEESSTRFANDPFYDEPLPTSVEDEFAYAAKAADLRRRQQAEESELVGILTFHYA